jgi:lipopolysaccharide O-acetyltransferase
MNYNFFHQLGYLYTYFLRNRFYSFGSGSVIKPFLNSANEQYISVGDYVNIGSFCRITVSTEFGGYKVKSKNKIRLKIGNHVDIGNNSFITANNNIEIGHHVIMSAYVTISDHDHGFVDIKKNLHSQPLTERGFVKIQDNVFLGVKSTILKNVTIGQHAVVGANAVVTRDIPAFSIAIGNPARVIKRYNFKMRKWTMVESR